MITQAQAETVQALLAEGLPVRQVARRTGASYGYVYKQAVRMGRKMTRSHPNDPSHPWSGKTRKEKQS